MSEMLLQSHTGCIAPLPALPDAWKDGQVSGLVLVVTGSQHEMEEKNLETLSFDFPHLMLVVSQDYPNIETSLVKVNGKKYKLPASKTAAFQLATQRVMSLPLKTSLVGLLSSDCKKDSSNC